MANMLYNGMELPDINSVWDKETYPYAALISYGSSAVLQLTSTPLLAYYNPVSDVCTGDYLENGSLFAIYLPNENGSWTFFNSGTNPDSCLNSLQDGFTFVWASYDVYKYIGGSGATDTLVLAASDPVPVGGVQGTAVITETSGDGFALYNGVKLPNIDSVWTDKTKNLFICKVPDYDASYFAIISTVVPYQDTTNGGISLSAPFSFSQYVCFADETVANELGFNDYTGNTWAYYRDHSPESGGSNFTQTVIWSSVDILKDTDGSTFLAATDPIPLDGMTVIEWNGVADGTYVNMFDGLIQLQKVGEYIDLPEVVVFVFNSGGTSFAFADTPVQTSVGWRVEQLFTDLEDDPLGLVTSNHTLDEKYYDVEPGLWFVAIPDTNTSYISLLAYPASSGDEEETDLKPVYKRVNGAWVKQTAYERRNGEWVLISTGET